MFIVTKVVDTLRISPNMLSIPSLTAIHSEMDRRYPNRVLMDVGLVICRYGDCLKIGDGICVNGDGGAHHECLVKLVIFRPFVDEVCTGRIKKSTPEGIQVSLGFFEDIHIPAYWMLRPSQFEARTGLWVWMDDDERYEMEIGSEIRFKIKTINFTQITNTAKGMQATTTTTTAQAPITNPGDMMRSSSNDGSGSGGGANIKAESSQQPVRKRSLSVDLSESQNMPATMHVVASICEDGLGLTSWWEAQEEEEEEEEEEEREEEGATNEEDVMEEE
ncbi:III subunit RPC8 [Seminavis robusta]|uniref:III subunit RPC8 n=1 Tax=Seminavis robusta TaxID=568900 RepID=A0A9N8EBR9_9STRA|nr:III subunit RPC8 [Seminavis robusta]|eukprot:Sro719_g192380.1 III subunit RPC8 (276) ;mRNA; f:34310-35137